VDQIEVDVVESEASRDFSKVDLVLEPVGE
jgi:hypothetical protein